MLRRGREEGEKVWVWHGLRAFRDGVGCLRLWWWVVATGLLSANMIKMAF